MLTLRPYQVQSADLIKEMFRGKHKRVILCLPTGAGKTVVFSNLASMTVAKGKRVLIVTDRVELLAQAGGTLVKNGLYPFVINADTKRIKTAYCYVAMVETLARRMEKPEYREALGRVDLIIIDEAHKGNFRKVIECFPNTYILGATATPISAKRDQPLKDSFSEIVEPVDIPTLIEQGFLCDAKTYAAKEEVKGLKVKRGEYSDDSQMEAFDKKAMYADCIKHWRQVAEGKKTLCFNINIEHSRKTVEEFEAVGITAQHLDGETPDHIRKQVLKDFSAGKFQVLCNVGVLTAGYDESSIECVIINRATKSAPLYFQCCGRGSRLHPGKDHFTIIDMGSNFLEHGLWNAPINWRERFHNPPKKSDKEGVVPVKSCPECDYAMSISATECPDCGYIFPVKPKEKELLTASEFVEVDKIIMKKWDAMSVEELLITQQHKGYKMGWVLHQVRNREPEKLEQNLLKIQELKGYKKGWAKHQLSFKTDDSLL